jgi:hypothetical protein
VDIFREKVSGAGRASSLRNRDRRTHYALHRVLRNARKLLAENARIRKDSTVIHPPQPQDPATTQLFGLRGD